jgi:hypothetical protein
MNQKQIMQIIAIGELESKGIEEGIKSVLDSAKKHKAIAEKKHIEEEKNEEIGIYHNEIAYATYQLDLISIMLSYKPLREDRKHIKTLCDEIRIIVDDLEKLI